MKKIVFNKGNDEAIARTIGVCINGDGSYSFTEEKYEELTLLKQYGFISWNIQFGLVYRANKDQVAISLKWH